jgi:16S rRNA (guanine966-N2)-methyltransferase
LVVPKDDRVRPTSDRVREAWFSILGVRVESATVLDLFAGSGALGLEALSRGAAAVTFVETNRASLAALAANIESLGVDQAVTVVRGDALRYVEGLDGLKFDVALADPPYDLGWAPKLATRYRERPFASLFAIEHRVTEPVEGGTSRRYGDTVISFFEAE